MKSREKFSENSILDHFLQQHLLFDHSSNYDKLITIHNPNQYPDIIFC